MSLVHSPNDMVIMCISKVVKLINLNSFEYAYVKL